jgi:hypothetical protein
MKYLYLSKYRLTISKEYDFLTFSLLNVQILELLKEVDCLVRKIPELGADRYVWGISDLEWRNFS